MKFVNEDGEVINIADNMTLQELHDIGVSISLSEDNDPSQNIWLAEEDDAMN